MEEKEYKKDTRGSGSSKKNHRLQRRKNNTGGARKRLATKTG